MRTTPCLLVATLALVGGVLGRGATPPYRSQSSPAPPARETLRTAESKYSKAEVASSGGGNQQPAGRDYAEQTYESFKYAAAPQDYGSQESSGSSEDESSRQQYYSQQLQHQHQEAAAAAAVAVGNQAQSSLQKAAAQKYVVDGTDDKNAYLIPLPQLLNYFRAHGMYLTKGKGPVDRIPLPIYMTPAEVAQNQLYAPQKVTYPDYTPGTYQKQTVISESASKIPGSSQLATSNLQQAQYAPAPLDILGQPKYQYVMSDQPLPYAQQQQQQFAYVEQDYPDVYNTAYEQDNSIYEQPQQPQQPQQHQEQQHQQQYQTQYVPIGEQFMLQFVQQPEVVSHAGVKQQHQQQPHQHEVHEPLQHDFIPPQYQAQKFRASHQELSPHESYAKPDHYIEPGPKTLLDSYIPSHVIAAADANRYRERPIKLESGFLPSKINFVRSYKKRKSE